MDTKFKIIYRVGLHGGFCNNDWREYVENLIFMMFWGGNKPYTMVDYMGFREDIFDMITKYRWKSEDAE